MLTKHGRAKTEHRSGRFRISASLVSVKCLQQDSPIKRRGKHPFHTTIRFISITIGYLVDLKESMITYLLAKHTYGLSLSLT